MGKLKNYTDKQLLEVMRADDQRGLLEIYDRYLGKMLGVAGSYLNIYEDAEECVQDVIYNIWKLRGTITLTEEHETLSHYIAVALKNQAFKIMDKHHRQRQRAAGYTPELALSPSAESELIAKELNEKIEKAITGLPPQCQLVFKLSKEKGLSNKEISSKVGISENTVKFHLKKASKDIKGSMEVITPILIKCVIEIYCLIHP